MKPLIVLLFVFFAALLIFYLTTGSFDFQQSGRFAMSTMLLLTASGHFKFSQGMARMIPDPIPYKVQLVYLTGFIEIAAAAGLLIPSLVRLTSWFLIVFFILLLPANIHAALKNLDYEKGTYDGNGPRYLWFRIPLQILFIAWVYFFGIQ